MSRQRMSVEIRGVIYPSAKAAARALGVSTATVYCALCRGDIDRVGLGVDYRKRATKGGRPPKPIIVAGRRFNSQADLARAIGRSPRALRVSLQAGGTAKERIALAVMKLIAQEENAARRAMDRAE